MRSSLKKPKPKAPTTLLQQQSTKLKQKLQLLREQVTQKKQQKQMNKTATSLQSASKPLSLNQTQNKLGSQTVKVNMMKGVDARLKGLLIESKLDTLEDKLREKGIKTLERFVQLTEEEVDEWKDVAVGWRIKLKKQLKLSKEKKQTISPFTGPTNNTFTNHSSQPKQQQQSHIVQMQSPQVPRQRNIEDIIKQRKQFQVFVPLNRQIQQLPEQQLIDPEMTEQDQDVIIQSFMKVFQPRKGIISKDSKIGHSPRKSRSPSQQSDKKVSWSRKVQQLQKEFMQKNHKKYPKESIAKWTLSNQQKILSSETIPEPNPESAIKYCWKCFRKINVKENVGFRVSEESQNGEVKYFCCEKCQKQYQGELEGFMGQLKEDRESEDGNDDSLEISKKGKYQEQEEEDLQTIDLSIL